MGYIGVKPAGISSASQVETDVLDVDNIRIDGNTISSIDTNGNISLDPDGTGDVIVASGNVGIGTSTVDSALHIEQDASGVTETSGSTLKIHNTNASGRSKISLHNSAETASGSIYYDTDVGGLALQGDTGAIVTLNTAGNNERMRIDTSGRVCIGGTNPSQKFVVTNAGANNIVMCENSSASIQMFMQATSSTGSVGTLTNHDVQFLSNNTERMRISTGVSGGMVRIGQSGAFAGGANARLGVFVDNITPAIVTETGDTSGRSHISFRNGNGEVGGIDTGGSSTSYNTSSDHRLKQGVEDMTGAIDRVKALAPKRFQFIADADTTVDGFLAHEAQAVVPEAVTGTHNEVDDDGNAVMQGIDQSKLVPLLTGALREAIAKIEALEARIEALETA